MNASNSTDASPKGNSTASPSNSFLSSYSFLIAGPALALLVIIVFFTCCLYYTRCKREKFLCFRPPPDPNVAIQPMTSGSSVAIQTEISGKDLINHLKQQDSRTAATSITDVSISKDDQSVISPTDILEKPSRSPRQRIKPENRPESNSTLA